MISDQKYAIIDKDANLIESAEISQNLATECLQQERIDTSTCVAHSNMMTEREQTEEVE